MFRRSIGTVLALAAIVATIRPQARAQSTQAAPTQRVRGTVVSVTADQFVLQPNGVAPFPVKLAPNWAVRTVAPMKLEDIKPNDFLGIGASGDDEHLQAIQVIAFPESLRGTGEGHYPWSVQPKNSMTNGTVEATAVKAGSHQLTVGFKGSKLTFEVPPSATVLRLGVGQHAQLVAGAKVLAVAQVGPGDTLTATTVTIAIDGAALPA